MATQGVPPTREKPRRPHHPLVVQKKIHDEFDLSSTCGICKHSISISFRQFRSFRNTHSLQPLHFIPLSFIAYSSAPHGLDSSLISTPQVPFIRSLPKPFSKAAPTVCIFFCKEFAPFEIFPFDYSINLS